MLPVNKQLKPLIEAVVNSETDLDTVDYESILDQLVMPDTVGGERGLNESERSVLRVNVPMVCRAYQTALLNPPIEEEQPNDY